MTDPYRKFAMSMAEATAEYIKADAEKSSPMRAFWTGWVTVLLGSLDKECGEAAVRAYHREGQAEACQHRWDGGYCKDCGKRATPEDA